jgi:hypothetical protein
MKQAGLVVHLDLVAFFVVSLHQTDVLESLALLPY